MTAETRPAALPPFVQRLFPARRGCVRSARDFTTETLRTWGLSDSVDDVRLCVSELASNAIAHGTRRGHDFLVRLCAEDDFVRLEVHDSRDGTEDRTPTVCHPADLDARGRGLLLVEAVADAWGVERREPYGKVVWARFKGGPVRAGQLSDEAEW